MTQEELAEAAGVSLGVIKKLERGGNARMETLHDIARALGVVTVTFAAPTSPEPQEEAADELVLADMRSAISPPIGLGGRRIYGTADGDHPDLARLRRAVKTVAAAYHADRYDDLARIIPALVRSAHYHVDVHDQGDENRVALHARADVLSLAGRYLIQVRAHDLALTALHASLQDATAIGDVPLAAAAISAQAHAMLRQGRLSEVEQLCADTASEIEPRMSSAEPDEISAWGWMLMRASAAAARNNRPQEATEYLKLAAAGAARLDDEHPTVDYRTFGPVTVSLKRAENAVIGGKPDQTIEVASHLPGDLDHTMPEEWQRHRLDHALALVRVGSPDPATDVLDELRRRKPHWLRYQQYARDAVREILQTRPRMPSEKQRALAEFMNVEG
ncbi:helix-turn-helix domain-containing protein [Actinoallomurus purpureus]|nr:helix-turn-helix domain-containing protein [Actinoallomurus purpureus]